MRPISEINVYLMNARIILAEYWYNLLVKSEGGVTVSNYEKDRVRIVKALIKGIQYDIDYEPNNLVLINRLFNTLLNYLPANFLSTTFEIHNPQMTQLINQIIISFVNKASSTVIGVTKLSVDPIDLGNPIALGNNDPRIANWEDAYDDSIVGASVVKGETYVVSLAQRFGGVIPIELTQSFRYIQNSNSATWVIAHNLGYRPSVTVLDIDGDVVNGNIIYNTLNQLTLTFSSAIQGEAYLN